MNVNGFTRTPYTSGQRSGVVPFRLQAVRDAESVDQFQEIEQRKEVAGAINRGLSHYQDILSPAVAHDNGSHDNHSAVGKVCMQVRIEGKDYNVFGEFKPNQNNFSQPITKAQVRQVGQSTDLFSLDTDTAGAVTVKMLDPVNGAALSVLLTSDGKVTAGRG